MQSTDERLELLEKRVEALELEISQHKKVKQEIPLGSTISKRTTSNLSGKSQNENLKKQFKEGIQIKSRKTQEAFLGKYIVGALAALLIFVGTASFIGLIWKFLNPEIKISLMTIISLIFSGVGFRLIQNKKNPIASVTLGIGAGLMFITILSANLAFHMIGNEVTLLIAGIWAMFFILSTSYINQFFTIVIANIGSFITLILGLSYMKNDGDYISLTIFLAVIASAMYWVSRKKRTLEKHTILAFILIDFTTLLIGWFLQVIDNTQVVTSFAMPLIINGILMVVLNVMFELSNKKKANYWIILPSVLVVGMTSINFLYLNNLFFKWDSALCLSIFFAIQLIQLTFSHWQHKELLPYLSVLYTYVLIITGLFLGYELYQLPTGIVIVGIILMLLERIFKTKHQEILIAAIILLDAVLLLSGNTAKPIFGGIAFLQSAFMIYLLWYNRQFNLKQINPLLRIIGLLVMMTTSISISKEVLTLLKPTIQAVTYIDFGYGLMLLTTGILWRYKFFSDLPIEGETETHPSDFMRRILYGLLTIQYVYGLILLNYTSGIAFKLLLTLEIIAVALVQSHLFIHSKEKQNPYIGIWLVVKYLVLIWSIILSFAKLDVTSAIYSVAGLLVAILSITAGFKMNIKSIRLYGLILTIIMVIKFILVDLSQENSIVRVLALVSGGALCFLISYIYNRLSEEEKLSE